MQQKLTQAPAMRSRSLLRRHRHRHHPASPAHQIDVDFRCDQFRPDAHAVADQSHQTVLRQVLQSARDVGLGAVGELGETGDRLRAFRGDQVHQRPVGRGQHAEKAGDRLAIRHGLHRGNRAGALGDRQHLVTQIMQGPHGRAPWCPRCLRRGGR